MTYQRTLATAFAVAAICFFTAPSRLSAAGATITYTATGTFESPATSGADTLKLAGEPFEVSISVSSATKPTKSGSNWDVYSGLKLTGTVHSGLLGSTPVSIASGGASIEQLIDNGKYDQFIMAAPIKVVGISLTIKATINMPSGTIKNPLLYPFGSVTLDAGNSSVLYSDSTASTTLGIASGTLTATIPTGKTSALNLAPSIPSFTAEPVALLSKSSVWA